VLIVFQLQAVISKALSQTSHVMHTAYEASSTSQLWDHLSLSHVSQLIGAVTVLGGLPNVLRVGGCVVTDDEKRAIVVYCDPDATRVRIVLDGSHTAKEADVATLTPVDDVWTLHICH